MTTSNFVDELHAWRRDWKIRVKVLKRWNKPDRQGLPGLNFILVDENGCRINASCGNIAFPYFYRVGTEGRWLELSKFGLIPSKWKNEGRTTRHNYQIILTTGTEVSSLRPLTMDPFMKFVLFSEIYRILYALLYPVDLIGVMENVSDIETENNPDGDTIQKITFTITDLEDVKLKCIAYGDFAADIKERTKGFTGLFAVSVLTDWSMK
ncbi:uncharacterized protein LOC112089197 [Eutrema salsugineum]|uniref:uncharacterized protein LOC112089197 n=1 Tax=Eutrema salsugineum TaxID=72664 RepID=UPI000CED75B6|nr:uncharacterized protein LOC112089197 [Eutrema salsugineum]